MPVFEIPNYIREILSVLESAGYVAYLVGGCVRDMIMGRTPHDYDVAASARSGDVVQLFKHAVLTGEKYGTVTVVCGEGNVEVTTFRCEKSYSDGRHPGEVVFVGSIEEDLSRRDFTVNAIAMSADGELIDPFGGVGDIGRGIIKCVGDPLRRFGEDALRMFRAYRFSAQLGFEIEEETKKAIGLCSGTAERLSDERVRDETEKILMSPAPEIIYDVLKSGLMTGRAAGAAERSAFAHLKNIDEDREMRWYAFSAILKANGCVGDASEFLRRMRLEKELVRTCRAGAEAMGSGMSGGRTELKKLIAIFGAEAVTCAAVMEHAVTGIRYEDDVRRILESGECVDLKGLAVSGDDLLREGYPSGEELGRLLRELLMHVVINPGDNDRVTLIGIARSISNGKRDE